MQADGRTYTVTLREGLHWSDGHPLTTDDVVFTYALMVDAEYEKLGSPYRGALTGLLADVSAENARTVTFRTREEYAPFLVAHGQYGILPHRLLGDLTPAALAAGELDALPTVVSGVFSPVYRTPGEEIVFARNPLYHRGPSRLDEFVYRVFPNGMAVADALGRGEVDVGLIDPSRLAELTDLDTLDDSSNERDNQGSLRLVQPSGSSGGPRLARGRPRPP